MTITPERLRELADAAYQACHNGYADALSAAAQEIEQLEDQNEGLWEELRCAVKTAYRRGAKEWAGLNYSQWIDWLEQSEPEPVETPKQPA